MTTPTTGRVAGKVALVVGAASGIGKATAKLLAKEGATVCCADLHVEGANQTARELGGEAWGRALDVTREDDWIATLEELVTRQPRFDILVNSAGISHAAPIVEETLENWRRVMAWPLTSKECFWARNMRFVSCEHIQSVAVS